ncbi:uncharacterized protein BO95DRAFT_228143 [Aspergillus brunneoviolaceus CBS 621.78]|uniref:Uncharacterized protein n=1 Tax=Aspergillus brunneoviolaceus CBS 621.78 TaxID=1450534 RepID=A0ACD1G0T6_9EURO|nr:hypothetical protein BO95DRAFT_228143 [Aspergillus brunneoviolaceus CBS 621.78]RAH42817.1 hypothetical protein BO95DRAFT_228143 [Aspergillus brunneoviolaceus CBS 621.78]
MPTKITPLSPVTVPAATWRHLLRSLLREASYLPDPVAKGYMHRYVLGRFRHYANNPSFEERNDLWQRWRLRKTAIKGLSVLQRANQGYMKPLEKVLRMAYGRTGRRRRELILSLITRTTPPSEPKPKCLEDLLAKNSMTEDWKPPRVVQDLLKAQLQQPLLQYLDAAPRIKDFEPVIPEKNSWARPVPHCRRRNIRKKWYSKVLANLLPPVPRRDLKILEGLISGQLPWMPPKRRKATGTTPAPPSEPELDVAFLVNGPKKGQTFKPYAAGRPHVFTRRFMLRIWMRISSLIPRVLIIEEAGTGEVKHRFTWKRESMTRPTLPARKDITAEIFEGVDSQGKLLAGQLKPEQQGNDQPQDAPDVKIH